MEKATFGAGCFWQVEATFRQTDGVTATQVGYLGGAVDHPTYEQVCTDRTGHAEVVEVEFDPERISYDQVLDVFWGLHDPTQLNRQGPDRGTQYRSAIFYKDAQQQKVAEAYIRQLTAAKTFSRPIVTEITNAGTFYPAEDYHQDFYKKSPVRYHSYRLGCGRDARLRELWGAEAGHDH